MGVGNRGFVQGGCELQNCYTTTSRNKLRGADAVVFHGEDLGNAQTIKELKILKKFRHERRAEGQKVPLFVYFMKEPPHKVQSDRQTDRNILVIRKFACFIKVCGWHTNLKWWTAKIRTKTGLQQKFKHLDGENNRFSLQGNKLNDSLYLDFFDLTFTYQPDSDVEAAYGKLVPKDPKLDPSWPKWRPPVQANVSRSRKCYFYHYSLGLSI